MRKATKATLGIGVFAGAAYANAVRHEAGAERRDWFQHGIRELFMPLLDRSGVDIVDLGFEERNGLADEAGPSILYSKHQRAVDIFTTFHSAFSIKPDGIAQIVAKHQIRYWPLVSTYINGSVTYLNRTPSSDAPALERHASHIESLRRLSQSASILGSRAIIGANPEGTYAPHGVLRFKVLGPALMPALLAEASGEEVSVRFVGIARNTLPRYIIGAVIGSKTMPPTQVTISKPLTFSTEALDWYNEIDPVTGKQYGVRNPKILSLVETMEQQMLYVQNLSQMRAGLEPMVMVSDAGSARRNRRSNRPVDKKSLTGVGY